MKRIMEIVNSASNKLEKENGWKVSMLQRFRMTISIIEFRTKLSLGFHMKEVKSSRLSRNEYYTRAINLIGSNMKNLVIDNSTLCYMNPSSGLYYNTLYIDLNDIEADSNTDKMLIFWGIKLCRDMFFAAMNT